MTTAVGPVREGQHRFQFKLVYPDIVGSLQETIVKSCYNYVFIVRINRN